MPPPFDSYLLVKKNKTNGAKESNMLDSFDGFCILWRGADPGE